MTGPQEADDANPLATSDPNGGGPAGLAGGMGVSSERVGKIRGSAEPATHGLEDTTPEDDESPGPPPR